ncbi:MAG: ABC transporter substrate-binding protein, partial [Pseudomonadota bacterium]
IIVNTDFAEANADAVTGFLGAVAAGWKDAIAAPATAIESLVERNPAADAALEERRLQLAIDANVLTEAVVADGMGSVDADRMAKALEQIAETYEFQNAPDASLYFTDAYLPAAAARMLN